MPSVAVDTRLRLFGIRHHGPGSARSLVAALNEWRPTVVLIEGPIEAEALVSIVTADEVKPPVAMLLYSVEKPRWASYYPLVEFSPEYQAMRWAVQSNVPVRFIDLPATSMLGLEVHRDRSSDAMERMAEAAGFDDTEDWWEHLVEQRGGLDLFEGLGDLMAAIREIEPEALSDEELAEQDEEEDGRQRVSDSDFQEIREAHMRRCLREALSDEDAKVAVVCGAWHVPALRILPSKAADEQRLKGLPKLKVAATIVPWTFDRLTRASGYGAGARSPAFYDLLWKTPADDVTTAWLLAVARLMREEDLDASPASVIEAVRLADALAALRGRSRPGLKELSEAASSVLIRDQAIWQLIGRRLIVGERLGEVPDSIPAVPLQTDLQARQKRLRMTVDTTDRVLELDLRNDNDLYRSRLLHQLGILGIRWGIQEQVTGKKGTFHEHWRIMWQPELAIDIIEASPWGNTVPSAAISKAISQAKEAQKLDQIAVLVEQILLADLEEAMDASVQRLQALSATTADVAELADALPPLAGMMRYGSVRRTEAERIEPVLDALFVRLCVGLPPACVSLDDEAARMMSQRLTGTTGVVRLFEGEEKLDAWKQTLFTITKLTSCHAAVAGKAIRLLFDLGAVSGEDLAERLQQEASIGTPALEMAAFVEGLLEGHGAILLHQEALWRVIDEWVCGLPGDVFDEVLPLVRRTFALFTRPERRQLGELASKGVVTRSSREEDFNQERAERVVPIVRQLLGLPS